MKLLTVNKTNKSFNNNYLSLIKIFTVNNFYLVLMKIFTVNKLTVNEIYQPLMKFH